MSRKLAFCITGTRRQAEDIMHCLESEDFSDDHISVIFPDKGAMILPGIGSFIAAGPIIAAMRRAAPCCSGDIASGLAALGISKAMARHYQGEIEGGNFLLSVHACTTEELGRAKRIFSDMGARDVCSAGEPCPVSTASPG